MRQGLLVAASCTLGLLSACGSSGGQPSSADGGKTPTDASTLGDAAPPADAASAADVVSADAPGDASSGDAASVTDGGPCAVTTDAGMGPGCPNGSGNQCGTPQQCGTVVQATEVIGPPPAPQGGTIAQGLYYLTTVTNYRGQPGYNDTYQFALQVTGATFAEKTYQHGDEESPISGTFSVSATTLTRNLTCPITSTDVNPYTATATTLTIFHDDGTSACSGGTTLLEFTLQ
jgi:hypothetical protein